MRICIFVFIFFLLPGRKWHLNDGEGRLRFSESRSLRTPRTGSQISGVECGVQTQFRIGFQFAAVHLDLRAPRSPSII